MEFLNFLHFYNALSQLEVYKYIRSLPKSLPFRSNAKSSLHFNQIICMHDLASQCVQFISSSQKQISSCGKLPNPTQRGCRNW